jgi:hypothetical protein
MTFGLRHGTDPEGMGPLGRPRNIWEDNMRMDLKAMGCECVDWICLVLDSDWWMAFVNVLRNLFSHIKCREFLD